jgi:predicted ribosomally synthesized peptide with SipW-like signal peptide
MPSRAAVRATLIRRKLFALLSGGLIVGVGATATLATWNDSEWVFGGVDSSASGIQSSTFEVEQNRTMSSLTGWDQQESEPGGALTLTAPALALTPGDATFTQVSLRTTSDSVAGTLDLLPGIQAALPHPPSSASLWAALQLRVVVTTGAAPVCDLSQFGAGATFVIGGPSVAGAIGDAGTLTRSLAAAGGNQQNYCFEISLPAGSPDSLMGEGATPVWEFRSTSA